MKYQYILPLFLIPLLMPSIHPASATASFGDVVTCEGSSSVYYLAEDGKRYVFPSASIYFTHYLDFDAVEEVPCEELSAYELGGLVLHRHGSTLVKIQSVPTVYAVEPGGVLRALHSEEMAKRLFGDDWAQLVQDVAPTFFSSFTIGEPLEDGELPQGMILTDDDGDLLEVESDGEAVEVEGLLDDIENREQFERIAQRLSVIEQRIEKRLAIRDLLQEVRESGDSTELDDLLERLETVRVRREERLRDRIELHQDVDKSDAQREVIRAEREITRAERRLLKRESQGKDVTFAEELLTKAGTLLNEAKSALEQEDYELAEQKAEQARDYAKDARMGWAVHTSDDEEVDDEDASDDATEDTVDDETNDESEDTVEDDSSDDDEGEDEETDDSSDDEDADESGSDDNQTT